MSSSITQEVPLEQLLVPKGTGCSQEDLKGTLGPTNLLPYIHLVSSPASEGFGNNFPTWFLAVDKYHSIVRKIREKPHCSNPIFQGAEDTKCTFWFILNIQPAPKEQTKQRSFLTCTPPPISLFQFPETYKDSAATLSLGRACFIISSVLREATPVPPSCSEPSKSELPLGISCFSKASDAQLCFSFHLHPWGFLQVGQAGHTTSEVPILH